MTFPTYCPLLRVPKFYCSPGSVMKWAEWLCWNCIYWVSAIVSLMYKTGLVLILIILNALVYICNGKIGQLPLASLKFVVPVWFVDKVLRNAFLTLSTIMDVYFYRLGIFFQSIFDVNSQVTWNTKLVTFIHI